MQSKDIDVNSINITETLTPLFSKSNNTHSMISSYSHSTSPRLALLSIIFFIPYLLFFMALGFANIITAFELWLSNGYTLGKWVTKIKVVRLDDEKITFWDAFLRDIILKFLASAITSGILNMVSFVLGCATPDHKTVHDLAAKTKVINIKR